MAFSSSKTQPANWHSALLATAALSCILGCASKSTSDSPPRPSGTKHLQAETLVATIDAGNAPPMGSPAAADAIDRSCQKDEDCQVIATYCGGWTTIKRSSQALAREHYDAIGAIKNCREGAANKPDGYCEQGQCGPESVFNSERRLAFHSERDMPVTDAFVGERAESIALSSEEKREALDALTARLEKERPSILDQSSNYRAQFMAARAGKDRHRFLWGNFFCGKARLDWEAELMLVKDGGECYFRFRYDFDLKQVVQLWINGRA